MRWLDRLLGREEREGAGGVGAWSRHEQHRADKQQAAPGALEVEGDPRGGLQDPQYRTADPREVVQSEGVTMSGPGGAPQEGSSAEERRDQQRS